MFHITFVQIGAFDWLSGRQKGSIFIKMFKNLLFTNHLEDEAETWYICLGHYPLQKLSFYFGRIRSRWLSGRASASGSGGRGFESRPRHTKGVKNGTSGYLAWCSAL